MYCNGNAKNKLNEVISPSLTLEITILPLYLKLGLWIISKNEIQLHTEYRIQISNNASGTIQKLSPEMYEIFDKIKNKNTRETILTIIVLPIDFISSS